MTEAFSFLHPISRLHGFKPAWIPRLPDVDVLGDRAFALANLAPHHDGIVAGTYPEADTRHHAEQVHGHSIATITEPASGKIVTHPGVDGLMTNLPNQLLAIYIADCAALYLTDPVTRSIVLLHSGRKGSEENILGVAVEKMTVNFDTNPADLICVLSPCIRPPHYEVDFAGTIAAQAAELGIINFHDSCQNTAEDTNLHYSYRIEKGQTGRMLALLSIES